MVYFKDLRKMVKTVAPKSYLNEYLLCSFRSIILSITLGSESKSSIS